MSHESTIAEVGANLGIPDLALDGAGGTGIRHESGVEVDIQLEPERAMLHVCAPVAAVPGRNAAALYLEMLQRSDERASPLEPVFAIDRDTRQVVLSTSLPLEGLEAAAVVAAIDATAAACSRSREWLASLGHLD